jgi:hypothetical protein
MKDIRGDGGKRGKRLKINIIQKENGVGERLG